jgi:DNA repair protein RecN (Recombination protein N)
MLQHLHIRNLAIVDEVEVELSAGLTTLTGETGAGKSILVDALGLALGERADSEAVRPGSKRAEITASFEVSNNSRAANWLSEHDLDDDDEGNNHCVLRRVVTAEGRSRGYINGNPAPMQTLRELGDMLVDICGQQAHQSLVRPDNQRALLDQYGKHDALVAKVRDAHQAWQSAQQQFDDLDQARADQSSRIDLLSFQVQELEALDPKPGEIDELDKAHRRAANASKISEGLSSALQALHENEQASAHDLLSHARSQLDELGELDPRLIPVNQMLGEAEIQISEAAETLRGYLSQEPLEAANLAELETRLGSMHDMARKHRIGAAELPELTTRLREELHAIEHADDTLEELQQKAAKHYEELLGLAVKLSKARQKSALTLAKKVSANMQQLGMPDGTFSLDLDKQAEPGAAGFERIEFRVSLNPGMRPGALTKVASGGELSRVSLAIQVAASDNDHTPTLIFDEVDAGVGGGTADIVGEKLRNLTKSSQVLCVTHLAQVASKGHNQLRVSKLSDGDITRTRVAHLTPDERVEELARMLGGVKITATTRDHAAEMLAAGNAK